MADHELFDRLKEDLEARGISAADIQKAKRHWLSVPNNEPPPCPMCLLAGRKGKLKSMPNAYGVERLQCDTCKEPIELSSKS